MFNITNISNLNKLIAVKLKVEGVPSVMHPTIGDEISDGVTIAANNQVDYITPFNRSEGECELINTEAEFMDLSANSDNTATLTLVKKISNESDEEIEKYVNGLSTVIIDDHVDDTIYMAIVIGVERYDIQDF